MLYRIPVRFSVRMLMPAWMGKPVLSHLLNTDNCNSRQTSLDGVVSHEARTPAFTNAGLLDFIIELIVCEDEVCRSSYCIRFVLTRLHNSRHSV